MTGAENLMNTVINSLSMIDRGFTVTLTVTPHNFDYDGDDYEEEDDDDEPHVSDDVIEEIKEFARRINEGMSESVKSQVLDHCEGLLKEKYSSAIRSMGDDELAKVFQGNWDALDKPSWPNVGDDVWYKTKHGNYECGKVKVVCHNTIQLDNNVTLERKDCKRVPFEVGDEVYFDWLSCIKHGVVVNPCSDKDARVDTGKSTYCIMYESMFSSVDEVLHYLKSTADE